MKVQLSLAFVIYFSCFSSWAMNQYEWDEKPTVYVTGTGPCAKAVCVGLAKRELVGYAGPPQISYGSALCGATSDSKGGYTCPPAQECMEEETTGITVGKLSGIKSQKKPVIYDADDSNKQKSAGATK